MEAALGEADWIRLGLDCRSALWSFGVVGRDFLSHYGTRDRFYLAPVCLMGCPEGVPDVFGKDVGLEAGVPPGCSSQPQVGISGV